MDLEYISKNTIRRIAKDVKDILTDLAAML